jgi:ABC-2 type transport system permease protein
MHNVRSIFKREFASYFATPLGFVFVIIFLLLANILTFSLGRLYESNQADLSSFFYFHPWLYLFLVPAISMGLWANERKSGSIELLLTFPVTLWQAVLAKYLAAWAFCGLALSLTFPIWITINYLGDPDNGAILAGYLGSLMMAGGFLAIGSCLSAATRDPVVAFILSLVACFLFLMMGFPPVLDFIQGWMSQILIDVIASLSIWTHFESIKKGVIDLRDLIYFGALIGAWLIANTIVLDLKKAD